jgi:hypothetical protein
MSTHNILFEDMSTYNKVQLKKTNEVEKIVVDLEQTVNILRRQFNWTPPHKTNSCSLSVSYNKVMKGPPYLISAKFSITAIIIGSNGKVRPYEAFEKAPMKKVMSKISGGLKPKHDDSFCLEEAHQEIKAGLAHKDWKSIERLVITVKPTLNPGKIDKNHLNIIKFEPADDYPLESVKFKAIPYYEP